MSFNLSQLAYIADNNTGLEITGPWSSINTQTAPASGLIQYDDVNRPPGQAFYRTVQP